MRESFGAFSEYREVGKSVRGRAGANRGIFKKNLSKAGVYRSAGFAQTGLFQVRKVLIGVYRSAGFAQTGLFSIREYPPGGYRSTGFAWTGPCCIREGILGGYRSSSFARTGPSKVRNMVRGRVPVYQKGRDRSLSSQRLELQEGTGLRKTQRPVPVPKSRISLRAIRRFRPNSI